MQSDGIYEDIATPERYQDERACRYDDSSESLSADCDSWRNNVNRNSCPSTQITSHDLFISIHREALNKGKKPAISTGERKSQSTTHQLTSYRRDCRCSGYTGAEEVQIDKKSKKKKSKIEDDESSSDRLYSAT